MCATQRLEGECGECAMEMQGVCNVPRGWAREYEEYMLWDGRENVRSVTWGWEGECEKCDMRV